MNENVIDPQAALAGIRLDRRALDRLAARGAIGTAAWARAVTAIEPPRRWGVWVGRLLTTVGTALVLAGVVWFFASNWNRIPPFAKLGAIAAMIVVACLVVGVIGFGRQLSQATGSAAIVLVGVFLAVEGQIHQTGADAWTLFAAWAGLTLPWALLLRSAAAWTLWLAVADLALIGWFDQTMPADGAFHAGRNLCLIGLHGGFLLAREAAVGRGVDWPSARWTRFVLGLPILAAAAQTGLMLLDRPHDFGPIERAAATAILLVFAALFATYRRFVPDVAMLAAVTVVFCGLLDFTLFRLTTGGANDADLGVYFLMGLATLGLFALAVAWLRGVARDMEAPR